MRTATVPKISILMTSTIPQTSKHIIGIALCACALLLVYFDPVIQPLYSHLREYSTLNEVLNGWRFLGEEWAIAAFVLCAIYLCCTNRRNVFLWFTSSLLLVALVVQSIKHLLSRARPTYADFQNVFYGPLAYLRVPSDIKIDSMPSGHTAAAFAMATCLSEVWPCQTSFWYFLATGVGLSRIVSNVHFTSDVFIGAALGIIVSQFMKSRFKRHEMISTLNDQQHDNSKAKEYS